MNTLNVDASVPAEILESGEQLRQQMAAELGLPADTPLSAVAAIALKRGREIAAAHDLRVQQLRRLAEQKGYRLIKSRARKLHINNQGKYQLRDHTNTVVDGVNYDSTLDQIEWYLNERAL